MTTRDVKGDSAAQARPLLSAEEREHFLGGLDDPLTVQAIEMMVKRPVSPGQVAAATEQPVDEVRRHLDELRTTGLVSLVDSVEVGGELEPFYHGPFIPFHDGEEWAELSEERKRAHLSILVRSLQSELDEAMERGTLGAWPDFHLCRRPFIVDEQCLYELREVFDTALYKMVPIVESGEKRLRETGGEGIRGQAALMLFKLPDLE